ncbi:MAG: transporter substrate-binding domain-containing protein [Magnetococcales bacterium]|nr:transporter substrate-binding domain-containing protein [Magnetococcales bacterium]
MTSHVKILSARPLLWQALLFAIYFQASLSWAAQSADSAKQTERELAVVSVASLEKSTDDAFNLDSAPASFSKLDNSFKLTPEEQEWLQANPAIKVGINNAWPPMDYVGVDGQPHGIGVGFIQALNQRLGGVLQIVPGSWKQIYRDVQTGQLDALMDITPREDRKPFFNFTHPYITVPHSIFAHHSNPQAGTMLGLAKGSVAVEKGFFIVSVLNDEFSTIEVQEYSTTLEALQAVSKGEADAYIGNRAVAIHTMREALINDLDEFSSFKQTASINAIGVRKDWPILYDILEKALDDINPQERKEILENWTEKKPDQSSKLLLTHEERTWLNNHPVIRVASDPAFAPIEFRDENGHFQGISWDYLETLSSILGITFEAKQDRNWPELIQDMENRQVDLFSAAVPTSGRKKMASFTAPYLSLPTVIYTQKGEPYLGDLSSLNGKKVAVAKGFWLEELLNKRHPELIQIPAANVREALFKVAHGEVYAYVDILLTASHYIQEEGLANLQVSGHTPYRMNLAMGVRSDWPQLVQLLNKAINQMDKQERLAKIGKWSALTIKKDADRRLFWQTLAIAGAVLLVFLFWIWSLQRQINEREKAENEMRKLLIAVEHSPSAVLITDTQAIIEYVNPAFTKITGYKLSDVLGKNPSLLQSGQTPQHIYQALWTTLRKGKEWSGELLNRKKDGSFFWESVTIAPIINQERVTTHYIAAKEDITQRKLVEKALAQAKEHAEAATRAKSDFLANMSHEIRTPMNAIIGMSHLALNTDLDDKQRDYIAKVHSSAQSLLGIINDILDFSKIEAGKLDMESVPFNLDEVLNNLANFISTKAEKVGLEVSFYIDRDVPLRLIGDPLRLGQILLNLLNNALKFTLEGNIVLSIHLEKRTDRKLGLHFKVEDSGIGMDQEQQKRLFKAFSQADSSTTRKFGGTGLGLTISKRLVEMMDGRIWLISESGKGSIFHFTAIFGRNDMDRRRFRFPSNSMVGMRVLVVDDNPVARNLLKKSLASFSFEVNTSDSARSALSATQKAVTENRPFEIIYLDWKLAETDHLQTIPEIRRCCTPDKTPAIILLTANTQSNLDTLTKKWDVEFIISKPTNLSKLFNATIAALGHQSTFSQPEIEPLIEIEEATELLQGATVLLVEDNEINQQVAQELLQMVGITVQTADNGQQAVEAIEQDDFDAVLMDIQMPVMDGFAATGQIRTNPRFESLPIIAMTANAMAGDREKSLKAGMNDHLAKPVVPEELYDILINWVVKKSDPAESASTPRSFYPTKQNRTETVLYSISGLDCKKGMQNVGNKADIYVKILKKFILSHNDSAQQMIQQQQQGDYAALERSAHTLKGLAATIGANNLSDLAAQIEHSANNPDRSEATLTAQISQSGELLSTIIAAIKESLPAQESDSDDQEKSGPDHDVNPEQLALLFQQIHSYVNAYDTMAEKMVTELILLVGQGSRRKRALKLQAALDGYDFEACLTLLQEWADDEKIDLANPDR